MSTPRVDLTEAERTEILACEHEIGRHTERIAEIYRRAAVRDGIDEVWLALHP